MSQAKYNITPEFEKWYYTEMYPFLGPFIIMTIFIILFNGFTLYLFYLARNTIKIPEKYVISMTCSDFFAGVANIFIGFQNFYIPALLDHNFCYILQPLGFVSYAVSLITLLVNTVDRYHCTAFPHHYRMKITPKIANGMYFIKISTRKKIRIIFFFV